MDNKFKRGFRYFKSILMKTTNGMAIGLFGTLIIGTVFGLLKDFPGFFGEGMNTLSNQLMGLMGAGIGLGVALSLKRNGITVVTLMAAGFIGGFCFDYVGLQSQFTIIKISDPLSCYISVMLAAIVLKFVMVKKTPVDLILIPLLGLTISICYSFLLAEWVHYVTIAIQKIVELSFSVVPFLMCIIVSVLMGMALTAPISSVAICVAISIGNVPLAATAALIGCCTQMVGFAVHTAHDNKWGSVLAVGLGTSMLQFKNIVRKPLVWLPTIIVSAILGPFAMLFPKFVNPVVSSLSVGAGMGTCGLVGPLNFMGQYHYHWLAIVMIFGFGVVASGVLVFLFDLLFRKIGWIKPCDYSLKNNE